MWWCIVYLKTAIAITSGICISGSFVDCSLFKWNILYRCKYSRISVSHSSSAVAELFVINENMLCLLGREKLWFMLWDIFLIGEWKCVIHLYVANYSNTYISRLCYDASVHLSVTEVHWRIIGNLGFKFQSTFTAHCGFGACCEEGRVILRYADRC